MIKTFCDVCKKEIGVEVSKPDVFYPYTPCSVGDYKDFITKKHDHVCCECLNVIREAINAAIASIIGEK